MNKRTLWIALAAGSAFALVIALVASELWFPDDASDTAQVALAAALFIFAGMTALALFGALNEISDKNPPPTGGVVSAPQTTEHPWVWITTLLAMAAALLVGGVVALDDPIPDSAAIKIVVVTTIAVGAVMLLLFIGAIAFRGMGIGSDTEALGLPQGSIRALIAVFLILTFVIMSIFLFGRMEDDRDRTVEGITAQQLKASGIEVTDLSAADEVLYDVKTEDGETHTGLTLEESKQLDSPVVERSASGCDCAEWPRQNGLERGVQAARYTARHDSWNVSDCGYQPSISPQRQLRKRVRRSRRKMGQKKNPRRGATHQK